MIGAAPAPSPWTHGVALVERATGAVVGSAAFKGPPDAAGVVELAYGLAPAHQGRGYAREAARALSQYALGEGGTTCVRAHTRSDNPASARVLLACGFTYVGEVVDPEDGRVQRWELRAPVPPLAWVPPNELAVAADTAAGTSSSVPGPFRPPCSRTPGARPHRIHDQGRGSGH